MGGFGRFLGNERAICGATSDLEGIECAAFNIFMKKATLFGIYLPSGVKIPKKKNGTKHK